MNPLLLWIRTILPDVIFNPFEEILFAILSPAGLLTIGLIIVVVVVSILLIRRMKKKNREEEKDQ